MYIKVNNSPISEPMPLFEGKEIIIGIDSSKSNSALCVRDKYRNILKIIEFDGKNDGTREVDTLNLCVKHRAALKVFLQNSKPILVGIENIITKKTPGKESGITIHESRFKITAVFMSFISFFQDNYGLTPELINNQSWKAATLPEKFRSREYDKGSLAYFKSIGSPYGNYSDDATDSICISEFLCDLHGVSACREILEKALSKREYTLYVVPKGFALRGHVQFVYNREFTLKENADVMSNAIADNQVASANIPIDVLTLEDIYEYCRGEFSYNSQEVTVAVFRSVKN